MHLFDFNQALAGRKLLTDKKSGAEMEGPRNSLDLGGSIPEVPKPNAERNDEALYGYQMQKSSASRKSNGMPIKALIAEELSKESDSKNRAPSVVARLMGLEALPTDSKALQKPSTGSILGKIDEKFMQRPMVERQRHEEIAPHSVRLYAKKAKASAVSGQITPKSSHSQRNEIQDRNQGSESPLSRNHPQEQQLQEFKKEFEAWQSQKSWASSKRSSRLDDAQVRMPRQQSLPRERQLDAKPAVSRESFPAQNVNAPEERLHESREFQDALDFLQSNKEFFMRFLHEPNSLFARHLQDNESESPLDLTNGTKHRRPQQAPDTSESPRPPSWARESPMSRQHERVDNREDSRPLPWSQESPSSRSPGGPLFIEKGKPSMPYSPVVSSEESLRLHDQRSYPFSSMPSENRLHKSDSHVPTRIVVLKPSPGRVRNLKSTSPVHFRSPKDHIAYDAFREDNTDVLERLREKLRKDNSVESNKFERKNGVLHINEQYRDSSKDPREIAREIARQVRENITRDLMVDPRYASNVQPTARKKSVGRRLVQGGDPRDPTYSDAETREPSNRAHWDSYTRSSRASLQPEKNFDLEVMRSSPNQKADMIEQVKRRVSDSSTLQGHDLRVKNIVFDRDHRRDSHHQFSPALTAPPNSKGFGQPPVEGSIESQPHDGSLCHDPTGQVEDCSKGDLAFGSDCDDLVEQNKTGVLGTLLSLQSEEAKNEPELQMREVVAEVSLESVLGNEVVDVQRPTAVDANPMDLATSDANLYESVNLATAPLDADPVDLATSDGNLYENANLAMAEVKQTSFVMEEHAGLQLSEEAGAVATIRKEQSDVDGFVPNHELSASLHTDPSVSSANADGFTKTDSLQANEFRLESIEELKGQTAEFGDVQTLESDQMSEIDKNDLDAPLDSTSEHTCETNFSMQPVREQPEQPSPVSVLDLPFQDESSVATEFKELSSDLEELRMRLRLLNFDNDNQALDNDEGLESELDGGLHPEEVCNVDEESFDHMHADGNESLGNTCSSVADWKGEGSEMCYVRDVLAASGFTGDNSSVLTHWYAPGQPLNPRLFQNLEKSFSQEETQEPSQAASKSNTQEGVLNVSRRHLLFDCANEVLLNVLGPYMNRRTWSGSKVVSPMPTGKDLVKLVWTHVWCSLCSHSGSQETLENLVMKDLGKGSSWLDVGIEMEAAGLDVERAILDDLIEETLLVL